MNTNPGNMHPHLYNQNTSPNHQPDKYRHECPHCDRLFACPHNVLQHCREQHEECGYEKLACLDPECDSTFARNWPLYRHMKQVHSVDMHPGRGRRGQAGLSVHSTRGRRNQTGVDVQPAGRRRDHMGRSSRRGVGRRGPVRVRPLEEAHGAWTITIIEDEPEVFDSGAEFVYDFNAAAGAEQMSESPFDYVDTGANFGVQEIDCTLCNEIFEDREDLLGHLHLSHAMAYSELCDCLECSGMKLSGALFHEDKSLAQPFELTQLQAQAGAPNMEKDESSGDDTAMDVDNDSKFQDSLTNWGLEEESPAEAVEPLETCA